VLPEHPSMWVARPSAQARGQGHATQPRPGARPGLPRALRCVGAGLELRASEPRWNELTARRAIVVRLKPLSLVRDSVRAESMSPVSWRARWRRSRSTSALWIRQ
jgi:hypothetical protein